MRDTTRRRRRLFARRPSPRQGEDFIFAYHFPPHIERGVRRKHPELTDLEWSEVERGLREWLICCAWRGGATLAMPSRLVDEAWHEFILDSAGYIDFCNHAYGEYLHHIPEGDPTLCPTDNESQTVHAWDRSELGRVRGESILWELDERLGAAQPLGFPVEFRRSVRATYSPEQPTGGMAWFGWRDWYEASDSGGGSDGGVGGGGCGGGGCGGGGG